MQVEDGHRGTASLHVTAEVVRADLEALLRVASGDDAQEQLTALLDRICAKPSAAAA